MFFGVFFGQLLKCPIVYLTEDDGVARFQSHFSWRNNTQRYARITEQVRKFAEFAHLRHKTFHIPSKLNVTSCIDPASVEGSKLLDFLTDIAHFRETAPSDVTKETLEAMTSLAKMGDDGNCYVELDCDVMLIFNITE